MQVTEKGQITIPKRLRDAVGILPGSQVSFVLDGGKIIIQKAGTGTNDRRAALRAAAAKVRTSLDQPFRQMDSEAIMAFLRPDDEHA
ncbi:MULTISPECIES: AbrB/MazE/SpoVT family DNA-binding domain-containing protein [Alcaligenaceae]|uniref:AbrB family looped-hinge helix DNA binding protein n=1 Tax=Eoetvoesiella caeni TaxID=645616 RepID=A0A366H6T8_9BURK|nr:AbrB/MazE/SpoVT family DNA-binding domain-containing protein [Eoetvoesiella caeni]MCI2810333.1 AbrB/MazE/SpoVT family DNA-binding domain-containing protein [Eoetvoesiella caeni]NYT54702.1 AbrB/MazE/SpoVT family DNA-binding domain-containing protein [Eoetvoesiella caeni]RBP37129.1 AbrB family looped-hinge helix DNA binding protein [Eoetvoesiella caeni]